MRVDQGVALLVYRYNKKGKREYLILERDKNWHGWEIPKGHLEHNSHIATVFLELNEEAGIEPVSIEEISELNDSLTFQFEQDGQKVVSNFKGFKIKVSEDTNVSTSKNPSNEHTNSSWLTLDKAVEKLEYEEQKKLLIQSDQD